MQAALATHFSLFRCDACCGHAVYEADVMNSREAAMSGRGVFRASNVDTAGTMRSIALCQFDETTKNLSISPTRLKEVIHIAAHKSYNQTG